ncbi:MAG: hypothetical protein IPF44_12995 [Betaproteobacteria bacterium]|nr:hypothetical protein [Betaproteobacteria bacterium]
MQKKFELTALTRITPLTFSSLSSWSHCRAGILNSWSRFALPAFTGPCFLNSGSFHRYGAVCRALFRSANPGFGGCGLGGLLATAIQIPAPEKIKGAAPPSLNLEGRAG